jgi:hypothetical protein
MGGAVDTVGHATGDHETGLRQGTGKCTGMRQPGRAGAARAHDGDLRMEQQAGIARHEQGGRRQWNVFQLRREIRLGAAQQTVTWRGQPCKVGCKPRLIGPRQPGLRRFAKRCGLAPQLHKHGLDVATGRSQALAQTARAQPWRAQGDQPRTQFIHDVHALQFKELAQTETARW